MQLSRIARPRGDAARVVHPRADAGYELRCVETVGSTERRDSLFLYMHVPFCEMRCGFCNLFTTANPNHSTLDSYLLALARQAARVRIALGDATFSRIAIGGGTPTFLSANQLERLFDIAERTLGTELRVPCSVETSPRTTDIDKLRVLRDRGVSRISMGVQSFVDAEVNGAGRAQKSAWVDEAIGRIRQIGFDTLNLDLIYGLAGQSVDSWLLSLRRALSFLPEEIYLYPLYVRPLTGLDRWGAEWDDVRLECYRQGRQMLLSHGYEQLSMRMFRLSSIPDIAGPIYCCQDDGMVGVGCGARSYTTALHYSTEFAVGASGVREIIADYTSKPSEIFGWVDYGAPLDADDQRRRWVIKSLLRKEGFLLKDYHHRFGCSIAENFPQLEDLEFSGLAISDSARMRLTTAGLERSDAIGPWLYSPATLDRMEAFELR